MIGCVGAEGAIQALQAKFREIANRGFEDPESCIAIDYRAGCGLIWISVRGTTIDVLADTVVLVS
eukprot:SAG31_NODE_19456_length_601_cov_0.968127_1_plen_64_part_10